MEENLCDTAHWGGEKKSCKKTKPNSTGARELLEPDPSTEPTHYSGFVSG